MENSEVETADCLSGDSDFPNLSIFLETPTPSSSFHHSNKGSGQPVCCTKRELIKNFNQSDCEESDTDYKTLQEYASAASHAAIMESDSDDDLFSLEYTSILPGGATDVLRNNPCRIPGNVSCI